MSLLIACWGWPGSPSSRVAAQNTRYLFTSSCLSDGRMPWRASMVGTSKYRNCPIDRIVFHSGMNSRTARSWLYRASSQENKK